MVAGLVGTASRSGDAPATTACHPTITTTVVCANLDRDGASEEVTVTNVNCAHEYSYQIKDLCGSQQSSHLLKGTGQLGARAVRETNGVRDGAELLYTLRRADHRAPDLGTSGLVHLVKVTPDTCPVPRFLFLYQAAEPLLPPPRGSKLARFDVALVELSSRYPGTEIRLTETFSRSNGEQRRTILLRYSRRADRYVIYSPKL